jgi:hypothetical protein
MIQNIILGGVTHPISFSNAVQVMYQVRYKAVIQNDFARVVETAFKHLGGDAALPFSMELCQIASVGISNGYRQQGQSVELDLLEIADALLSDEEAISQIVVAYSESLPKPDNEKKPTPGKVPAKVAKMKAAAK